jgi:hypothetical protein
MTKKNYTKPNFKVIKLNVKTVLLQSSDGETTPPIKELGMAPFDNQNNG